MQAVVWNFVYMHMLMDLQQYNHTPVSQTVTTTTTEVTTLLPSTILPDDDSVCYSIYGTNFCFPNMEPILNDSRPIEAIPMSPEKIGTILYSCSKTNSTYQILEEANPENITKTSKYHRNLSIKIITHGYKASRESSWVKDMVDELLRSDDTELIIFVDWSKGGFINYAQAVANIRVVAVQITHLLQNLMNYLNVTESAFHMIGHSLGAHLMGDCGYHMQEMYNITLSRITALDPAGPFFQDDDTSLRLNPGDAHFVDVIHTDNSYVFGFPLSIGLEDPIGHVDFYPNGGHDQPGCSYGSLHCQHTRASMLFTESIRPSCTFMAVVCPSYDEFLQGHCWGCEDGSKCSEMGMKAIALRDNKVGTKLYLATYGQSPFCGTHYRVTIRSRNDSLSWPNGGELADLGIELFGARVSTGEISLSPKSVWYDFGVTNRRVIFTMDLGELIAVSLTVKFLKPSWRINPPVLHLQSVEIQRLDPASKWMYCFDQKDMRSNQYLLSSKDGC